jgi:C-terminal processing protease CtpA/Prc
MRILKPAGLALILVLAGCHKAEPPGACTPEGEKADILTVAQQYYLWNTELPAKVNPAAYATPGDLVNALAAQPRAEGKDRYFSYLTTRQEQGAFFDAGQAMGYGFGFGAQGNRLFILQVFPESGAAQAGFQRGDEILAVSATAAGLDDPAAQAATVVANGTLGAILNSATAGTTRHFRLRKALGGAQADLTATTSAYGLDPVPGAASPIVLTSGAHKVGYLPLRTFIEPASDLLRAAMGQFAKAGVTDLIVDLRYNGGGRLDVASVLLDLIATGHKAGDVMYRSLGNGTDSSNDYTVTFTAEANALAPQKVAFIVTGASASASELVVNALQPYLGGNLALVGDRTYGKPVGQAPYASADCDWVLMMISFQLVNASGSGGYFTGLPDAAFKGATVAAADDLAHAPGDPAETCTAAALQWIVSGAAPSPIPVRPAGLISLGVLHPGPSMLQRNLPGVF